MWELIRNDPILKTITVFIIGIFAFAFAFSIMFGTGNSGMEHGMNSGGYNVTASLGQIIIILAKIFIIVILIALIIASIKFIQKHIIANGSTTVSTLLKSKPIMSILMSGIAILLLLLVINMILPSGNWDEMMGSKRNNGVLGFLSVLLHMIAVISFVGLIIGLVMYFKDRYFNNPNEITKKICFTCKMELKTNWKCCPSCGTEKSNSLVDFNLEDNGQK